MESIAIIPARGGSKRIPRKNIKIFLGEYVISRAIQCAQASGLFTQIVVSTDDQEIADISRSHGAEVPFIRDSDLSDDHTTTVDVIADAIINIQKLNSVPELVCCIYPVTPLLQSSRLMEAKDLLITEGWDFVFAALEFESPIERSFRKGITGRVTFGDDNFVNTRTQDFESSYHDAGQFYYGRKEAWISKSPVLTGNSSFIQLNKHEVIDIDTEEDWALAEYIFNARNSSKNFLD